MRSEKGKVKREKRIGRSEEGEESGGTEKPPRFSVRSSGSYSEQLDAIMRTVSTFSFGPLDIDEDEVVVVVEDVVDELELLALFSKVPVISTLWPTCGESFDESASR